MRGPSQLTRPTQLLVEGRDAEVFFSAMLATLGVTTIQIHDFGGISQLRGRIGALKNSPGFAQSVTAVGIIRDAEENALGAFQSVCSSLHAHDLAVPARVAEITPGTPRIGVLILPGAAEAGALESVCLQSVATDPLMTCVDALFGCANGIGTTMPSTTARTAKTRLYAYLAASGQPGLKLGEVAQRGHWQWEHVAFAPLRSFLRALS